MRSFVIALAGLALTAGSAAAIVGPQDNPRRPTDVILGVAVNLPPSPCAQAGGRPMPGRNGQPACFVRKARLLPPGPCVQAGGREASEVKSGRQVCVRAGGGKSTTDAWDK